MKKKIYNISASLFLVIATAISVNAQYISGFCGNGTAGYSGDGGGAYMATLNNCAGVTVDGSGNVYIADQGNNVVRKVSPSGIISTFAGTGTAGNSGDGGAATAAALNSPSAVAADPAGNIYITDRGNHTIRKVDVSGTISRFAGTGVAGYSGDGDSARLCTLNQPEGIAVDGSGNLYIADASNQVVRKVDAASGFISTVAGMGAPGYSGDGGPALMAKLYEPVGVAIDAAGNLYVADLINNRIRKVSASGIITTFAGTGEAGDIGDGGPAMAARLRFPSSVSVSDMGKVYIADQGNYNVRIVNTDGIISRIAGTSTSGYTGDGGMAIDAKLGSPKAIFADGWGKLYIADHANHAVRVVSASVGVSAVSSGNTQLTVYPNPGTGSVTAIYPRSAAAAAITVTDVAGRVVYSRTAAAVQQGDEAKLNITVKGVFLVSVTLDGTRYTRTVTVQ